MSPVGVPLLTAALDTEVKAAAAKVATLVKAMADPAVTDLLPIDDANIDPAKRFRRRYMSILGRSPQQLRDAAIISAGWTTLIRQPAISDADLHSLVSRRLMTAERMLWYVGRPRVAATGRSPPARSGRTAGTGCSSTPACRRATVHRLVQGAHGVDHVLGDAGR